MKKICLSIIFFIACTFSFALDLKGFKGVCIGEGEEQVKEAATQMGLNLVKEVSDVKIKGKEIKKNIDFDLYTKQLVFANPLFSSEKATLGLREISELNVWIYEGTVIKIEVIMTVTEEIEKAFIKKYGLWFKGVNGRQKKYSSRNSMLVVFEVRSITITDTSRKIQKVVKKKIEEKKMKEEADLLLIMNDL